MAVDPPASPPWVYEQPASIVVEQISAMSERADAAIQVASDVINDLTNISVGGEGTAPPDIAFPNVPGTSIARPNAPSIRDFGSVDPFNSPAFELPSDLLAQLDAILANLPDPSDWESPIPNLVIPTAPGPIDTGGMPVRPDLDDITIPDDPNPEAPKLDALIAINIPAPPVLPDFPELDDEAVHFQGAPVNTSMNWVEPTRPPVLLNELTSTIRAMLAGDFAMQPLVEAMLFDREREREDMIALKGTQEAFDTWAARGFTMPAGMLVEQVNAVQENNRLEVGARARDILTKSADWQIANLRAALTDGIQLESALIQQFNNAAQRTFDAGKARLDADVSMFQAFVALFNAEQEARKTAATIFNAKLSAILARLEIWKNLLEGERLKGTLNETTARIFGIKVDAVKNIIEIFKARMEGSRIRSEVNKNRIEAYGADVRAYGELLQARKVVYDAYDSQMRGVESQSRVVEASARAFAATLEAQMANANIKVSAIRGKVDVMGFSTQKFVALAGAERDRIGSQAQAISARASAFQADCTRYGAELQANTEEVRLSITVAESRLRNALAYYETRVREYDQAMTRIIERGRVVVSALGSAGGMASQLASGAMSAMHVQASLSGSGSASTGWSNSYSYSESHNIEE